MNTKVQDAEVADTELVGAEGTQVDIIRQTHTVGVTFQDDDGDHRTGNGMPKVYKYLTDMDLPIESLVVVDARGVMKVATVVDVLPHMHSDATKWVIDIVDTAAYEDRKIRAEKKVQLKSIMDEYVKKMDEEARLESYASKDAKFAAILKEYQEL